MYKWRRTTQMAFFKEHRDSHQGIGVHLNCDEDMCKPARSSERNGAQEEWCSRGMVLERNGDLERNGAQQAREREPIGNP